MQENDHKRKKGIMDATIHQIMTQFKNTYDGDPWYGRSIRSILGDVTSDMAFAPSGDQHSIFQLLQHMINWRQFTITRLRPEQGKNSAYFAKHDWENPGLPDEAVWEKTLMTLDQTQTELLNLISGLKSSMLDEPVSERSYDVRYLLFGVIQHDIYHLGQIALLAKRFG